MWRKRREQATFHSPKERRSAAAERTAQERSWKEALREARQNVFEVFEDRGPGVTVPPAGLSRRENRHR